MLLQVLEISFLLLALLGYGSSSFYWFRIWRGKHSGSAHAMFLITFTLFLVAAIEMPFFLEKWMTRGHQGGMNHYVIIPILLVTNAFFHVAFSQGYFNYKEQNNERGE